MSTIRVARRERWTSISNVAIEDDRLSFRARGILVWLLSKPDGWSANRQSIARHGKEGEDAVRSALKELAEFGYLVRTVTRDASGRLVTETLLYETPPEGGNPPPADPGKPEGGLPEGGNPPPSTQYSEQVLKDTQSDVPSDDGKLPTAGKVRNVYPPAFETCWQLYRHSRRGGKGDAYAKWRASVIRQKECGVSQGQAIANMVRGTELYMKAMTATDAQFIKLASTFWGPGRHVEAIIEAADDPTTNTDNWQANVPEWMRG